VAFLARSGTLVPISSPLLGWDDFKAAFSDGRVLDPDSTGFNRSYGFNPYGDYDNPAGFPFLFRGELNEQVGAQRRVTGVAGIELTKIPHLDTFGFAWFSYNPGTVLVES
jgi:hypothetical protein